MNRIALFLMLLSILALASCSNQEKKAQENIKKYLEQKFKTGTKLSFEECSKLYILLPKDRDKMPSPDTTSVFEMTEYYKILLSAPHLMFSGCTSRNVETIIVNDNKFREWETGGDEFAMICFVKVEDKFMNEIELGVCARLDSALNILAMYEVKEMSIIRSLIKP